MHLTLLVPGLLWPREILRDTTFDLPHPALALLLGRGRRTAWPGEAVWIAENFGLPAPLPAAPLRLLGDRGEAGAHDWLCLDPVHLRLEERAVILDDPARLGLDADEDAALREEMAPLFAPLGGLVATSPGRWHLRLDRPANVETAELPRHVGLPADPALPKGPDAAAWRPVLAEAQTVLHGHAVNRRRAEAGRPTVNSLWPWGGGRLPLTAPSSFRAIWSDEPVLKGLAALAGTLAEPMPPRFTVAAGRVLARPDALAGSLSSFDAMAWRQSLARLESEWLAPALWALKGGVLRRLTLVMAGHHGALQVDAGRSDLWRFWRRPAPLSELPV